MSKSTNHILWNLFLNNQYKTIDSKNDIIAKSLKISKHLNVTKIIIWILLYSTSWKYSIVMKYIIFHKKWIKNSYMSDL